MLPVDMFPDQLMQVGQDGPDRNFFIIAQKWVTNDLLMYLMCNNNNNNNEFLNRMALQYMRTVIKGVL